MHPGANRRLLLCNHRSGNFGFTAPVQVVRIDAAEIIRSPDRAAAHVAETMNDPLIRRFRRNTTAKMLRAGTDSAAVWYWSTAQTHVADSRVG
ncbi:MAG: hypothetical protein R2912_02630 [Eubacteriales bacterium]